MRDINLLADLTNYIMLELGQPMHAFDNSIVKGITVIETDKNIEMLTLEGEKHTIEPGAVVICDERREPVAVAGVKGGLKSGISESTDSLLIESACFDCSSIRKTSRKIGLITDASLRYEKSLDPEMCSTATARMIHLLKQIDSNIQVTSKFTDVYNYHYPIHTIVTDADFISSRGGVKLSTSEIVDILNRLGFETKTNNEKIEVIVPSYRGTKDVSIKEDLVEEIFRMYGYDNIKSSTMDMPLSPVDQVPTHMAEYQIKHALASLFNLNEVHSYVWNYVDYNKSVGINETSVVHLLDSSKSGQGGLRTKLAPTLLKIADENKNKYNDISIFEIARTFDELSKDNLVVEKKKLAIVLASDNVDEKTLYFRLKEICEYLSRSIFRIKFNYELKNDNELYHPVNSCSISNENNILGEMGILYPTIAKNIDKRKHFALLELDINKCLSCNKETFKLTPTSKYQSVSVDFNFVADKNIPYSTIEKALSEFRTNYILEHSLKDIYRNDEILKDKISYTINFLITPKDKTLESSDIEKFSNRLINSMSQIGLSLRS